MNSQERVLAACAFQPLDRIPRAEFFWAYPENWQKRLGPLEAVNDVVVLVPNEGTFPTREKLIQKQGDDQIEIDRWGRTIHSKQGTYFVETLSVPLSEPDQFDALQFDPPSLSKRYLQVEIETVEDTLLVPVDSTEQEVLHAVQQTQKRACVFGKVGGPYLRSTYLRGEEQFLIDLVRDPPLARAIADKVACHLLEIGLEQIRRWSLQNTGLWVFDDVAYNSGPLFSPVTFEKIFLPAYRKMVSAFKQAGVSYVFFHSDGDIRLFLDMLIEAGFDGINPVEPRAGMKIPDLRKCYPQLILIGGMDNTGTLTDGPTEKIRAETLELLEVAQDGGVIIGSGYTGPDIPLEHFVCYHETCLSFFR